MTTTKKPAPKRAPAPVVIPGAFNLTDLGNAERFVAMHRDSVRYSPQRRKWLAWSGDRWRWDDIGEVARLGKATVRAIYAEAARGATDEERAAIAKHATRSESAERVAALVKLAATEPGIAIMVDALDADPWILNAANGTIDLRTGELREHRRSDLITKSTLIPFTPDAKSELWDRVLRDATGGDAELATYLQRMAGYSLIGESLERVLFFVFGEPGTAKSTLLEALHGALGDYARSADFETWLQRQTVGGNRGDLVRLAGARLVTSVEVRKGARWDEALVKRVTGGDELTAAAKFEAEITFRPSFTLLLAANDAPKARDDDAGMWARMRRVPLTAVIPATQQDPTVKTRLREPEHATAILAWAVVGCLDYQRDGFGTCKAVERSTADYRAEMDLLGAFFEEALKFEPGSSVSRKTLREVYERWCREAGVKVLVGAKDFGERLRARGASDSKREGTRFWCGVRLLDADEESETDGARGSSGQAFSESPSKPFLVKETSRETPAPAAPLPRPRARQISLDPDSGELVEVEL